MESPYLEYLHRKDRFPRSLVHRPIRRFFKGYLDNLPLASRVLDAGCGNGIETGPYADRLRVCGIDYQRQYLSHCRETYPKASYATADLEQIPFAGDSFDLIVLNQVIEHLADPGAVVAELARVLIPGGRLLVATPNYGGIGWPLVEATYHRWFVKDFDAEENHVVQFRPDNIGEQLAPVLEIERVGTVSAGLILVAAGRKPGSVAMENGAL